ncbi:unnamed protein product [Auanema sp. JU1783]|nr:unnamed protein product [Auanema sp. JU1783]
MLNVRRPKSDLESTMQRSELGLGICGSGPRLRSFLLCGSTFLIALSFFIIGFILYQKIVHLPIAND